MEQEPLVAREPRRPAWWGLTDRSSIGLPHLGSHPMSLLLCRLMCTQFKRDLAPVLPFSP